MNTIYYVGIDLGTSRSSITASTGKHYTTITCVGYAKDIVSQKRLNSNYLLGSKALENRLSLNMVWPLAEGIICENEQAIEATRILLKHIINEVVPEQDDSDQIFAAVGVPAQANIQSKQMIIDISREIVDKILIVSEAFAVAYSIDRFDESLIVDIGAGTTDLCRMHGAIPEAEDQLTLTYAGNYLDQELSTAILKKYPKVQITPQIIKQIKEKYGYVYDVSEPVSVILTTQGIPQQYDITDILRESCVKLTTPLSQSIQQLIASFDPEFQEKLRHNIIIAGGGSRLKGIDIAIEKSLEDYGGGKVTLVQDAEFCGSKGALKMCMEMPEQYWEQI